MRKLILILFCFNTLFCSAQKKLTNSRTESYLTYIYKLSDADLLKIHENPDAPLSDAILNNPVDSFRTEKTWKNNLPPGHYAKVWPGKNKLSFELIEKHTAYLNLLNNGSNARFVITDREGNIIKDATVMAGKKRLQADKQSGIYKAGISKQKMVNVQYKGVSNFFKVTTRPLPSAIGKWFSVRWRGITNLFKKKDDYESRYYNNDPERANNGFIIFNKPKYKPNDTVRFKAFIVDKKSKKPINISSLHVKLYERYGDYDEDDGKLLGTVKSYGPGLFEYSFVLTDSLDLDLDDTYIISLEHPNRFRPESDNDADDEADEKEEESRSKVYMAGSFKYEEYELKSITFNMRTDKTEHQPGDLLNVFLKATDENDLPVPDGRVELTLTTNNVIKFGPRHAFVPDTLWKHTLTLDPLGETKLTIPDSVFRGISMRYNINAHFYNSANEHRTQNHYATYQHTSRSIKTEFAADSLHIRSYKNGKPSPLKATVYNIAATGDTIAALVYTLPVSLKINPQISYYYIQADSLSANANLKDEQPGIDLNGYRTADSIFIKVINTRKLHFWYDIYAGQKMIAHGEADSLFFKQRNSTKAHVTCLVYYNFGGTFKTQRSTLPYNDKQLTIQVKQPISVYPGQKVTTEISVNDYKGKPVAGADITAWAVTSKFEDYPLPYIPYLGKQYPYLKGSKYFNITNSKNNHQLKLNWKRWSRQAGLDSIEYYRFTHPDTVYSIAETLHNKDTLTQIAPFVVKNGDIVPVHIVYIDGLPVYFSQADQLQRYSFGVRPGKHSIGFRTQNRFIQLVNDVVVPKNRKLILSLNADSLNTAIIMKVAPDTLTDYEAGLLNKYMIRVTNNFKNKLAVLKQTDRLYVLNSELRGRDDAGILTGPLVDNYAVMAVKGKPDETFVTEAGFDYTFLPGLLKQKSYPTKYPFSPWLINSKPNDDYTQYALNATAVDSTWQNYLDLRSRTTPLFKNINITSNDIGRLSIGVDEHEDAKYFIKSIIIYRNDDPDFINIYQGNTTLFDDLRAGKYRLFFLLKNDSYAVIENIVIKPYGNNYYPISLKPKPRDQVSIKISTVINNRQSENIYDDTNMRNDALLLKEAFNEKYLDKSGFTNEISGVVTDKNGEAIPGVMITIKGTPQGVATNLAGIFRLKVPATGKIMVSFVGYETVEKSIRTGGSYNIELTESTQRLDEVVVVGYGAQKRSTSVGAVSMVSNNNLMGALAGRIAGISITSPPGNTDIYIRGVSSINGTGNKPLIIIDGEIVTEDNLKTFKPDEFEEVTTLKDAAATAIYGARAANGVLIIVTKKKSQADKAEAAQNAGGQDVQTLRRNFRDYAYWQPRLTTNAEGKTSFTNIFPDDITKWRTFVVGVTGNRQTGYTNGQVKAYKPLSAAFISPQFAVQGDKITAIGKVMNYNAEPAIITRTFNYNGKAILQDELKVLNAKIDTLNIIAADTDSLTFEYAIKRSTGYFDGEQRKIPVILPGVEETKGVFEVLQRDTTINLNFDEALGMVTLRAEASALPVLMEETAKLRDYRYLCNEQLASKLKGLLIEKRIDGYLQQPFKHEKNLAEVLKKLVENRSASGAWGWWKNTSDELWISLHAMEALLEAEKQGYKTNTDKKKLADYLTYQLESYKGRDKITCLELLTKMEAKVDIKKYAEALYKQNLADKNYSRYDRLRILLLMQQAGISIKTDELLKDKKTTLFGNVYWGEDTYSFFDNSIQLSLLAYKLLKTEGKQSQLLRKITGYLLEQRHDGGWRNTYESSLVLETILPELLAEGKTITPSALKLNGAKTESVSSFPYTTTFKGSHVSISKTGTLPVYLTGYQKFTNANPKKVSKDFTVDTWFEKNDNKLTRLKGGQQVQLNARVTARADGDFVMIEIPIPAGCSYESKEQGWGNNEVHREYFKEKVSIFCRKLKQGTYTFTVNLMPRYDGDYTLNPAKAELMYFPVFYGREEMRRVVIGGK